MSKTIIIAGYGPGVSASIARKFGAQGFQVALVGRSADKLADGVKALEMQGVKAAAFTADLGDPTAVTAMIEQVRAQLGPITVLEWTAYTPPTLASDLLTATAADLRALFDTSVLGLVTAVQSALPDLRAAHGALLVTNGAGGLADPTIDALLTRNGRGGVGVANAAKHKVAGLLAERLRGEGVYVGEVMIAGAVRSTALPGNTAGMIEADAVAETFWEMYTARREVRATIKPGA